MVSSLVQPLTALGPHGKLGVMVCGHGSRNRLAVGEFAQLAEGLRSRLPGVPVDYGYLEFARPILRDGLDNLRAQGVEHVLAVPGMLFAAGHAKNDIPSVLNTYAVETGLRIDYGRELGIDRKMIQAAAARISACLEQAGPAVSLHDTLLVVVGRGSSDPDADSNVSKVTRMLVEGMGFGWGETLYSGVTFPLVEPGLRHALKLGFRRIVVFPYFLFSGVLVSRIQQHSQRVADDHPETSAKPSQQSLLLQLSGGPSPAMQPNGAPCTSTGWTSEHGLSDATRILISQQPATRSFPWISSPLPRITTTNFSNHVQRLA